MAFHSIKNPLQALAHPTTWAGLAGVSLTSAQALPEPHKTNLNIIAGVCSAVAVVLKQPPSDETKEPQSKEAN